MVGYRYVNERRERGHGRSETKKYIFKALPLSPSYAYSAPRRRRHRGHCGGVYVVMSLLVCHGARLHRVVFVGDLLNVVAICRRRCPCRCRGLKTGERRVQPAEADGRDDP